MHDASRLASAIVQNVSRVLRGKEDAVTLAVTAFLAGGHLLLEDVPGVGKTTLARALARSVGLEFKRVQFTSDLMPTDVIGGSIYDPSTTQFSFRPGPVFTHILLADEINRTTPKTQSALLEAMGEGRVSVDGATHEIEPPFFVVATQNPHEFHGTYPLPESQLDRFALRLSLGYPAPDVEREVLSRAQGVDQVSNLSSVADRAQVLAAQEAVSAIIVAPPLLDYLHSIVLSTRQSPLLALGTSTRAALAFTQVVRARALVLGRDFATPDDVKALAAPALAHRVKLAGPDSAAGRHEDAERVIKDLLSALPVPL